MFSAYSPSQVEALSAALERYCAERSVTNRIDRESLAVALMDLFDRGVTTVDELVAALRRTDILD